MSLPAASGAAPVSTDPFDIGDGASLAARLEQARDGVAMPFSQARVDLVARAGAKVLRGRAGTANPAVVHFAFWTRAAALAKLKAEFERGRPTDCLSRPIGLVFHLPPQNVETVFLYSWVLSYLAGNANIVRLPSELGDDMAKLLQLFIDELAAEGDASQLFVRYPSSSPLSAEISALSDGRVVWGGDAKVAAFAEVPLRNGGKSLWFGDRFSFSVMAGAALATLDEAGRRDLAARFHNDVYVFDQMACASPHVVYVVGNRDSHAAPLKAFLAEVVGVADRNGGQPATGHAIRKMVEGFAAVGRGEAVTLLWENNLLTAAETPGTERLELRVGGGYLQYRFVSDLDAVRPLVRGHDQTLTYFGFDRDALVAFAARPQPGLTRLVPFGQALDFSFVWDSYDIPRELTRLIQVI
jgi:hypothetical protein